MSQQNFAQCSDVFECHQEILARDFSGSVIQAKEPSELTSKVTEYSYMKEGSEPELSYSWVTREPHSYDQILGGGANV